MLLVEYEDIVFVFVYYVVDMLLLFMCDGVIVCVIVGIVFGFVLLVVVFLFMFYVVVEFVLGG